MHACVVIAPLAGVCKMTNKLALSAKIDKQLREYMRLWDLSKDVEIDIDTGLPMTREQVEARYLDILVNSTRRIFEINKRVDAVYQSVMNPDGDKKPSTWEKGWYTVTLRPKPGKITFDEFRNIVEEEILTRNFVETYAATYEQKGETEATLGDGFHVHIAMKVTGIAARGDLARKLLSTLQKTDRRTKIKRDFIDDAGVDVRCCFDKDKIITQYFIKYESKDGHKALTKEMDALWRERNNIPPPVWGPYSPPDAA